MSSDVHQRSVAFIGFGEAAIAFARGFRRRDATIPISAYDVKTDIPDQREAKIAEYETERVSDLRMPDLVTADCVFSTVTAKNTLDAAKSVETLDNSFFFDCNSCAPSTKVDASDIVEANGGRYVDTAVMSPVGRDLRDIPILISGRHAAEALPVLTDLGMAAKVVEGPVGSASSRKMVRSIMIKGIEALTLECFLAARKAGVDHDVLQSLERSFEDFNWTKRGAYNVERVTTHGVRRAAEMREVAKTVDDLGLPSTMAQATAAWHQRIGDLQISTKETDLFARVDEILNALED